MRKDRITKSFYVSYFYPELSSQIDIGRFLLSWAPPAGLAEVTSKLVAVQMNTLS